LNIKLYMKRFALILPTKASILLTSVMLMALFAIEARANFEEVFDLKATSFERLWQVSMNKLDVTDLDGELSESNWNSIRPKTKTVRETAALIVRNIETNEIKLKNMSMGDKSSGTIYFGVDKNEVILGRFHTHPFEYPSLQNLPFSPRDVVDLYTYNPKVQLKDGYFSLIKSGEKYFALIIENEELAISYFKQQEELAKKSQKTIFDFLYKKFYSINKGSSIQEIQLNSLLLITEKAENSGIGLFESENGNWKKLN
jgi:hypothetical protein